MVSESEMDLSVGFLLSLGSLPACSGREAQLLIQSLYDIPIAGQIDWKASFLVYLLVQLHSQNNETNHLLA